MLRSNFSKPSEEMEPPIDQMKAKAKSESSTFLTFSTSPSTLRPTAAPVSLFLSPATRMSAVKRRQRLCTVWISVVTMGSKQLVLRNCRPRSTVARKRSSTYCLSASLILAGISRGIHERTKGCQPSASGVRKTTPRRETVAGLASSRSPTSKSMRICVLSLMRSPFARQSVMLSSSTVFMFSIQMASMGPSKTVHLRSSVSSAQNSRMMVEPRPSVHSPVILLNSP